MKISNDRMIEILESLADDARDECVRPLLEITEDAVQLDVAREEGEGECEWWMVDGDYLDALVIALPKEGQIEIADFDSTDWNDAREAIIAAKEAYYAK